MKNNSKINILLLVVIFMLSIETLMLNIKINKIDNFLFSANDFVPQKHKQNVSTNDLISFSIAPETKVHGILSYRGSLQGGYFFEGNVIINILDANKKILKSSNAIAMTDWMTVGPVEFEGNIDFSGLKKGSAYFEIHNDNASGIVKNDKSILIPIVIE